FKELEDVACPGAGTCGGQFTANTMATALEFIGLSPMGTAGVPAVDPAKDNVGFDCGRLVMDLLRRDIRPSSILTRASFENAIAGVAATGGSTNAVLHLLAMARESRIPRGLDDLDSVSRRTPIIASLKPGGRFLAADLNAAGGIGLVARRLLEAGLLDGSPMTASGKSLGEEATRAMPAEGQEVVST